jgi:hypothetical protein
LSLENLPSEVKEEDKKEAGVVGLSEAKENVAQGLEHPNSGARVAVP